jgi:L-ascorbate metabolism protein UlaG (beta-lactamase superfamily)
LNIVALANEGFLLRSADQAVLIDAFLSKPYAGYDALPVDVLARLEAAETPFAGIDLALVSHEHADHVQAEPARRFLAASPGTLLATSPQVLAIVVGDDAAGVPNHEAYLPEPGETVVVERNGVRVEFLRLSHGRRFASIQNLGHVITIGGQRVLHLGDAATEAANFRPYALPGRELDVALVPYWYFTERGGRALVEEHLPARHVIACHIPSGERAEIASQLAASYPHVIVPRTPLQSWTIEPTGD